MCGQKLLLTKEEFEATGGLLAPKGAGLLRHFLFGTFPCLNGIVCDKGIQKTAE